MTGKGLVKRVPIEETGDKWKELSSCQGHRDSKPVAGSKLQDWSPVKMGCLGRRYRITQVTGDGETQGGL